MAKQQAPQSLDLNNHINKSEDFVNKNKKTIIIALVAVLVLVLRKPVKKLIAKRRDKKAGKNDKGEA